MIRIHGNCCSVRPKSKQTEIWAALSAATSGIEPMIERRYSGGSTSRNPRPWLTPLASRGGWTDRCCCVSMSGMIDVCAARGWGAGFLTKDRVPVWRHIISQYIQVHDAMYQNLVADWATQTISNMVSTEITATMMASAGLLIFFSRHPQQ